MLCLIFILLNFSFYNLYEGLIMKILRKFYYLFIVGFIILIGCSTNSTQNEYKAKNEGDDVILGDDNFANVIQVNVNGNEKAYTFSVKIKSPDTGCKQYANWWEVVSEDGKLIYRRILAHSHVNEQPFTRSGGSVNITSNQTVIIRGHMNTTGYGSMVYKGNVKDGFFEAKIKRDFAKGLEKQEPLPQDCAF